MKAFFYTFGCKVNQYETENIKEAMLSEGYEVTEDYADALLPLSRTQNADSLSTR